MTDVVNAVKIPVYGIGGINEENITKIMGMRGSGRLHDVRIHEIKIEIEWYLC